MLGAELVHSDDAQAIVEKDMVIEKKSHDTLN